MTWTHQTHAHWWEQSALLDADPDDLEQVATRLSEHLDSALKPFP
ncbi:hypothetical protein [Gordonia shandongensis]|nr:hypothetical protein [Gordonia shandongensis]